MKKRLVAPLTVVLFFNIFYGRSVHRPKDPLMPEIVARWVGDSTSYSVRNYHFEEYPLQLFDPEEFKEHLLPPGTLNFRGNPQKTVTREQLTSQIEQLLGELSAGKRIFSNFVVLQAKDYNFKKTKGLIILKFKEYPFVVKLFMETPDSFISPFDKGMEPIFFFFMGGGINRHLSGFTRIKNREIILARLADSPWGSLVDIPRKWYWVPSNIKWIEVKGINIGSIKEQKIQFPGTYCIIADAIDAERSPSLFNGEDKKTALDLCNFLDVWIDPHMKNFMIEKETKKFIIVDTEHFPSTVGLREKITFDSYSNWYLYLAGKCWQNAFMQTKRERRNPPKRAKEMSLVDYKIANNRKSHEKVHPDSLCVSV
jgi:hypothetical protein